MKLIAPFAATLEWLVEPGAPVAALDVLAWMNVAEHCALRPLIAPCSGLLHWRRSSLLPEVLEGEPLAMLVEDPLTLATCRAAEKQAAARLHARLLVEVQALECRGDSPLRRALVEPTLKLLAARLSELEKRWPMDRSA